MPHSIGRLSNLQELNIAQNNIRWLPWEMLDLMHCRTSHRQITVRPNPLVDPVHAFSTPSPLPKPHFTKEEYREHLSRWGETHGAFYQKMRQWYSEDGAPWGIRQDLELRLKLARLRLNMYLEKERGPISVDLPVSLRMPSRYQEWDV